MRCPRLFLRSVALLLVVFQGLAWGAIAWAHSTERATSTVTIESKHDAKCLPLHDENRCPICQYAGSLGTPPAQNAVALPGARRETPGCVPFAQRTTADDYLSAPPRAPPQRVFFAD